MNKAVLFDLDGTLVNTFQDLSDATNYAMRMTNNPPVPDDNMKRFIGDGVVSLVDSALGPNNTTNRKLAGSYFIEYYLSHLTYKSRPYEGMIELVNQLKTDGYKLAVVTNKRHSAALEIVDFFFKDLFDYIIGETKAIPRKPAPDMVDKALKEIGSSRENAIFVGDSEIDFNTYKNSNIIGITCLYGFSPAKELLALNPTYNVNSPKELYPIIRSLFSNM